MNKMYRREFLTNALQVGKGAVAGSTLAQIIKCTAATGVAIETARLLTGCTGLQIEPEEPVNYPPLMGKKIQPLENGCYFGMHYDRPGDHMVWADLYLYEKIGRRPKIVIPPYELMSRTRTRGLFNKLNTVEDLMTNEGTFPFINRMLNYYLNFASLEKISDEDDFIRDMTAFAQSAVEVGRPFFFTTMHEMNIKIWPWGLQPKAFKKTWRRMHDIFDQEGANEYATWVFETYIPHTGISADHPERYYPGDDYVDWQGISGYSRSMNSLSGGKSLASLIHTTYSGLRKRHPGKPIMIAEFGKTKTNAQAKWLISAFDYIKKHPGLKAACYWDSVLENVGTRRDDHTLSDASFKALENILEDPYFVTAK